MLAIGISANATSQDNISQLTREAEAGEVTAQNYETAYGWYDKAFSLFMTDAESENAYEPLR